MADTKISALPAVATPAPTDEIPVNQGGTTRKMTRAQMHALEVGENIVIPTEDAPTDPTIRFGDGDSGFYQPSDDEIRLALAGVFAFAWLATMFAGQDAAGPALLNEAASATNPTLVPNKADPDTGLAWSAADFLHLVAGGLAALGAEDPGDLAAGETSLWLFDFDAGSMVQVEVGANDSAESGYRVLQVPNI